MTPAQLRRLAARYEDLSRRYEKRPTVSSHFRDLARECRIRAAAREHGQPDEGVASVFRGATR